MSIQSTIQTIQQIGILLSWGVDLAQIGETAMNASEFAQDLAILMELAGEVNALSYDLASLQQQLNAMFSLDTAPMNSTAMAERAYQVRSLIVQAYSYAMRTQTLLRTLQHTVQHIINIADRIASLFGNVSSQQNAQEQLAKLAQLETQAALQTTALQRAQSIEAANDPVDQQAIDNIKKNVRLDWPKRSW